MAMTFAEVITAPWFGIWFFGLFVTWMILSFRFARIETFSQTPKGTAHQVVVIVPFLFLAVRGTWLWFFDERFNAAFKHDKVYGYNQDAQNLVLVMFAFQVWDFVTTVVTKELRMVQHLIHHGACCVIALIVLMNGPHGCLLYYTAFFFGVTEVSSVPLAVVDFFRMHKSLAEKYSTVNEMVRVAFAVLFLLIRCIYWPFVCVDFWINSLNSGAPELLLVIWYIANIGMTCLQYYWGALVVKGIIRKLKGHTACEDNVVVSGARDMMLQEEGAIDGVALAQ